MIHKELWANREGLRDYLAHTVCDPQALPELKEYLEGSFERFMVTMEFLPTAADRILELGATPYFLTVLMRGLWPECQLELANFFGDDTADAAVLYEAIVENVKYGERHTFPFRQFNVERQPYPYPDNHFDGVLFCEILEHLLYDPVAALLECHRVLRPGGWLLLTTPNLARYENIAKLWLGESLSDQYSGHGPYGRHNREYTRSELEQLLNQVGFQIQRLEARAIGLPVQESRTYSAVRRFRPADRHEQHLFCLARRSHSQPNRARPTWLYRNLPEESLGLMPHNQEGIQTMHRSPMKISLINLNLVALDAVGACIINQVRFFQRRGDDVHVYTCHPPRSVAEEIEAVTRVVTLGELISGRDRHFAQSDLYIYHYPSRHELMESIRGIDRGTVIFYYHNVTPPELWGSDVDREELIRGVEGKALAHYADLCIADSPMNKQELIEIGYDADRIFVLPLVVDLEKFIPGVPDPELVERHGLTGQRVLLFVGRMAGNKRIDLLVEALPKIKKQVPNIKLLLVGDTEGSPAYRQIVAAARSRAATLEIENDVIWTGEQKPLPYYRLADVYVTASLHEGFGVPLIEAMACDVPVVASRAGAMPWVLGDAGLLAEPGNAQDLADKVLRVLQDSDLRQTLVARGRERVKAFSLERYEADLAEIVDKAVTYTLPKVAPEAGMKNRQERGVSSQANLNREGMLLDVLADEIEAHSDIMLRGYTVRSRIPLLGPLVAWVRRTLTSHLREPYLDPIVERQVEINRQTAEWLQRAAKALAAAAQRQAELEDRVRALEVQLGRLVHNAPAEEEEA
jgi:glycosyltransferase involved in cell wall biosynthesis